ncbi:MAG: thiol:disulfide interchange protein DsbA/DsbL [Porticoccaceae bacterium]
MAPLFSGQTVPGQTSPSWTFRHAFSAVLIALLIPMAACQAEPEGEAVTASAVAKTETSAQVQTDTPSIKTPSAPARKIDYQAGKHYIVLDNPVTTVDAKRVEVNEVFWYGCHHCFVFEPLVATWSESIADDTVLVKTPANWHVNMELHARAFYTAKALKVLDKVHEAIFEAMNVKKQKLDKEKTIEALFVNYGEVDPEKFRKTFNSFGVNSAVRQADSRQRAYQITGTPEMIVNGKYRITAAMAGGHLGMLAVVDHLVEKERAALQLAREEAAAEE